MLNIVCLIGRMVQNPELKYTPNNVAVCSFTLAVNRNFTKPGAEKTADFIDFVAWRQTAEFVSKYFTKGMQVCVEGSIQTRTYEDKNGNKRKVVEVVASQVHFAESKAKDTAAPQYTAPDVDFEAIPDGDDLPF